MNKLVWSFQILLSLAFGLAGAVKLAMPLPDLVEFGMHWIEDFAAWQVRTIGALEALGALGMTLPHLVKALPKILVPLAAAGLGLTMIGAFVTHVQRQDPVASMVVTSGLLVLCATVAWKRLAEVRGAS